MNGSKNPGSMSTFLSPYRAGNLTRAELFPRGKRKGHRRKSKRKSRRT